MVDEAIRKNRSRRGSSFLAYPTECPHRTFLREATAVEEANGCFGSFWETEPDPGGARFCGRRSPSPIAGTKARTDGFELKGALSRIRESVTAALRVRPIQRDIPALPL